MQRKKRSINKWKISKIWTEDSSWAGRREQRNLGGLCKGDLTMLAVSYFFKPDYELLFLMLFYVCVSSIKAMAPHSSTLAWTIPWTEEPGGLQSMESWRVGHDWATSLSLLAFMHWRRKWQPTPVFLPGESQGWGSLVGCRLWGRTESDMTEAT